MYRALQFLRFLPLGRLILPWTTIPSRAKVLDAPYRCVYKARIRRFSETRVCRTRDKRLPAWCRSPSGYEFPSRTLSSTGTVKSSLKLCHPLQAQNAFHLTVALAQLPTTFLSERKWWDHFRSSASVYVKEKKKKMKNDVLDPKHRRSIWVYRVESAYASTPGCSCKPVSYMFPRFEGQVVVRTHRLLVASSGSRSVPARTPIFGSFSQCRRWPSIRPTTRPSTWNHPCFHPFSNSNVRTNFRSESP